MDKEKEVKKDEEEIKQEENETENKVEVLDVDIQKLKDDLDNTTDRLKRLMAEFDNYKKRSAKERDQLYNSLVADIITAFLPVMDNLEKAIMANTEDANYKQGMELVAKQFKDVLNRFGVQEIETIGKPFDPEIHEAVASVTDENLGEKVIKEEYRKGYKIGSKVIRHSMVVVAN